MLNILSFYQLYQYLSEFNDSKCIRKPMKMASKCILNHENPITIDKDGGANFYGWLYWFPRIARFINGSLPTGARLFLETSTVYWIFSVFLVPAYEILRSKGKIEVTRYNPCIVARIEICFLLCL